MKLRCMGEWLHISTVSNILLVVVFYMYFYNENYLFMQLQTVSYIEAKLFKVSNPALCCGSPRFKSWLEIVCLDWAGLCFAY
jgi:hypothetical protein